MRTTIIVIAMILTAAPALARDCPSKLPSHPYEIGDTLSLGAEVRAFYFGIHAGSGLRSGEAEGDMEHNGLAGLRYMAMWYPLAPLTFILEGEFRYRRPGWENNTPAHCQPRPIQVAVEYDSGVFRGTAGLQPFVHGTQALLDQRGIGLNLELRGRTLEFAALGAMTTRLIMRNAGNSMWLRYISETQGWKFLPDDFAKNFFTGGILRYKGIKHYSFDLLYLYSWTELEHLRSHSASLFVRGPIVRRLISFMVEPLVFVDSDGDAMPGVVAVLRGHFWKSSKSPRWNLGAATAFRPEADDLVAPIYENLSWGLIRRYNLYQGHLGMARLAWQLSPRWKPSINYYYQRDLLSDSVSSDELDAGIEIALSPLYRANLSFVGLDLAGTGTASYGAYAEVRIVFGQDD